MPLALTVIAALATAFGLNGAGRFIFRRVFGDDAYPPGLGFPIGFAAASLAVTALAALGVYSRGAAVALTAVILVLAVWETAGRSREDHASSCDRWSMAMIALTIVLVAPAVFVAAAPPVVRDALVYHLPITESLLRNGSWAQAPGDIYGHFPAGVEAVFTLPYALVGDVGAAAVPVASLAALGLLLFSWLRERHGPAAALAASACCAATPLVGVFAGAAYIDYALCLFIAAAMVLIDRAAREDRPGLYSLAGAMAGMTVASKYTGLVLALVLTIPVLLALRKQPPRRAMAHLGAWALGGLISGAPFLLRNLALTGNPVYPFAYSFLGGPGWDVERAAAFDAFLRHFGAGRTLGDLALLPLRVSLLGRFGSPYFDGALGPYALVLGLLALGSAFLKKRVGASGFGLAALAAWAAFSAGTHQARFALPTLVLAAPAAAGMIRVLLESRRAVRIAALVALGVSLVAGAALSWRETARMSPFAASVSSAAGEEYRARLIPGYGAFHYLREHARPKETVFAAMTGNFRYASPIRFDSDCVFEDARLQTILRDARGPRDVAARFAREGWTYFFFDAVRLNNALDERGRALLMEFLCRYGRIVVRDEPFLLARIEPTPP